MRRIVFAYYLIAVTALAGCAFSEADRQAIIDSSARQASETASVAAYQKTKEVLLAQGKSIEEAEEAARQAADIAGKAASAVAAKAAEVATAKANAERSNTTGSWIAALLPAILGLVGAAAKKAVGA